MFAPIIFWCSRVCVCVCVQVMLLSMIAGGEGLNLVGGNHVFMLDLHWNPAVELQATDRAHRMGQTRNVHVHRFTIYRLQTQGLMWHVLCARFVCRGTVEEKIQLLQTKKLQLSASVLSGLASRASYTHTCLRSSSSSSSPFLSLCRASRPKQGNRLTLQDLKVLFQVE